MEYNHHDVLGNGTVEMKSHFVAKFWIRYLLHGVWAYWREEEGDGLLAFALRAVSDFMLLFASRALPDCLLACRSLGPDFLACSRIANCGHNKDSRNVVNVPGRERAR